MAVKVKYYVYDLLRKPVTGVKGPARAIGWGNRGGRDLLWLKGSDICTGFCRCMRDYGKGCSKWSKWGEKRPGEKP